MQRHGDRAHASAVRDAHAHAVRARGGRLVAPAESLSLRAAPLVDAHGRAAKFLILALGLLFARSAVGGSLVVTTSGAPASGAPEAVETPPDTGPATPAGPAFGYVFGGIGLRRLTGPGWHPTANHAGGALDLSWRVHDSGVFLVANGSGSSGSGKGSAEDGDDATHRSSLLDVGSGVRWLGSVSRNRIVGAGAGASWVRVTRSRESVDGDERSETTNAPALWVELFAGQPLACGISQAFALRLSYVPMRQDDGQVDATNISFVAYFGGAPRVSPR